MPRPPATPLTPDERWTLAVTVLGSSMAFLDGTVVNVALSAVQRDLNATAGGATWVVNAYALMLAALILAGGALGDALGRRRVYGWGVALFALASLACGLAPSVGALIAARAVQGVGAALLVPGSLAMIGAVFDDARRGRGVGLWSAASSVMTLLGPVAGGALVDVGSWRWVFFINLPLAAAVLWLLPRVPETRAPGARPDWVGAAAVTLGLGGLAGALTRAGEAGWDALTLGGLGLALAAFGVFGWWEARTRAPMLPPALWRNRTFVGTNLLTLLLYGALGAVGLYLPLYLIGARGFSATAAGAALLPLSLLLATLSGTFGALADRHGPRLFLSAGPALAGAGFALLGALPGGYWTAVFPGAVVLGLGMALTVAPLSSTVMGSLGREQSGVASGVNNAVARAAGLIAVAALGLLLVGTYRAALDTRLRSAVGQASWRAGVVAQAPRLTDVRLPPGAPQAAQDAVRAAFADAFRTVALSAGLLGVLGGVAGGLILRRPPEDAGR
ncbi:EmrB/QacA subfamily drug resistance transporter [Deinococcus metalli]|uniref:EmrB/QacA subfamily drug resistance transporter n=1 Tax=Deinococcus metalli TaxID=1141878 RepID=A0A7W8KGG9_9DEIO|nr:MFS transporter [Deinococcus metalli]MBB5376094.1 EmrB/QacA subfamily drug resistance transporter [Deinococcus metalli]GHF40840.1 MFS transporter [Deinococcus metalli]